jgi:hypothetical protein
VVGPAVCVVGLLLSNGYCGPTENQGLELKLIHRVNEHPLMSAFPVVPSTQIAQDIIT